jgi:hypothetical protein
MESTLAGEAEEEGAGEEAGAATWWLVNKEGLLHFDFGRNTRPRAESRPGKFYQNPWEPSSEHAANKISPEMTGVTGQDRDSVPGLQRDCFPRTRPSTLTSLSL